jgi:hypothetical protein
VALKLEMFIPAMVLTRLVFTYSNNKHVLSLSLKKKKKIGGKKLFYRHLRMSEDDWIP